MRGARARATGLLQGGLRSSPQQMWSGALLPDAVGWAKRTSRCTILCSPVLGGVGNSVMLICTGVKQMDRGPFCLLHSHFMQLCMRQRMCLSGWLEIAFIEMNMLVLPWWHWRKSDSELNWRESDGSRHLCLQHSRFHTIAMRRRTCLSGWLEGAFIEMNTPVQPICGSSGDSGPDVHWRDFDGLQHLCL